MYGALHENAEGHWNPTVESLAKNVLKHYAETDPTLYDNCVAQYERDQGLATQQREERRRQWEQLEEMAADTEAAW